MFCLLDVVLFVKFLSVCEFVYLFWLDEHKKEKVWL